MKLDSSSVTLVLVGTFPTAAFSIESLAKTDSIGSDDARLATYEAFVRGQVCDIRLPWGKFAAVEDKLVVEVNEAPYVRAVDLAIKCLRDISSGGVVRQMGINHLAFFEATLEERDVIGRRLLPPENWGGFGTEVAKGFNYAVKDPRHGGLTIAVLRLGKFDDRPGGYTDARVEPGNRGHTTGIVVSINDHYEMPPNKDGSPVSDRAATAALLDYLEGNFDNSVERSIRFVNQIIEGK